MCVCVCVCVYVYPFFQRKNVCSYFPFAKERENEIITEVMETYQRHCYANNLYLHIHSKKQIRKQMQHPSLPTKGDSL